MSKTFIILSALVLSGVAGLVSQAWAADKPGYTDTPMLPSGKWHVHDPNRPVPPLVTPGAAFSHGAPAPSDAIVLFDGSDFSHWQGTNGEPQWTIQDGCMECKPHEGEFWRFSIACRVGRAGKSDGHEPGARQQRRLPARGL